MFVSGGKRGLEIELSAENLAEMTKAIFSELTSK
ncbi:MAG: prolyl-tRNA editing enzyme YbaK/EbsC (Cys-tRNA(Pro) deacylase) [Saprospiraceae bacterium]